MPNQANLRISRPCPPVTGWLGGLLLLLVLTACGDPTQTAPAAVPASTTQIESGSLLTTGAAATPPLSSTSPATTIGARPTTVNPTTNAAVTTSVRPTAALKAAQFPALSDKAIRFNQKLGDLLLEVAITPAKIGNNTFLARLSLVGSGQAVTDARIVQLNATMLDMDMGVAKLELVPVGPNQPGIYQGQGYLMSMYGKYKIDLTIQRPGQPDATTSFEASVTSSK